MNHTLSRRVSCLLALALCACVLSPALGQPTGTKPAPTQPPPTKPAAAPPAAKANTATTPVDRTEDWCVKRNEAFNARAKQGHDKGDIGVIFLGDSITQGWEGEGKEVWAKTFEPMQAVNFGVGGDRTQHVLSRIDGGNLQGLAKPAAGSAPKLIVLMIGTNNSNGNDNTAEEIADGIKAVVAKCREKLPETKVLMLAIFPRGEKPNPQREKNAKASQLASSAADGKNVVYLDIGDKFLEKDGTLSKEIMPDLLHLSPKGYQIWADAAGPTMKTMMGEAKPDDGKAKPSKTN